MIKNYEKNSDYIFTKCHGKVCQAVPLKSALVNLTMALDIRSGDHQSSIHPLGTLNVLSHIFSRAATSRSSPVHSVKLRERFL